MDFNALERLRKKVHAHPHANYPVHSRVHPLNAFCSSANASCFVKRDDELGFGVSGNKLRKFRTLIPALIRQNCREAIVLGGPFSNNVLSLTQLLLENTISPTLFLRGSQPPQTKGNFLLLQMLLPSSSIHWIPRKLWPEIDAYMTDYTANRSHYCVIPEGSAIFSAFPGALTLPLDIMQNEEEMKTSFDHIFMDVGTGFSAAALLLGFAFLRKKTICHLLLLADEEQDFLLKLQQLHTQFEAWIGEKCPFPMHFKCVRSPFAASFGATNKALFKFLVQMARDQGFFLDPIYSGKLFYHAKEVLENNRKMCGNILMMHSGGALTLTGFLDQIENCL